MCRVCAFIGPTTMIATLFAAALFAELVGYLLHRVLHSDLIPSLSRSHLIHHLVHYGPQQPMRTPAYQDATVGRLALGNVGMEWTVPIALILLLCWGGMNLLGVSWPYQLVALITMISWAVFMFSYLHDRMHLEDFWMARAPLFKNWFLRARRLHDIHHHSLNDHGQMDRNFGIGFFFFDRLFGTLRKRHFSLNKHGYRAALRRYHLEHQCEEDSSSFQSGFRV